jgi:uncharacterized protein (DUF302 family)
MYTIVDTSKSFADAVAAVERAVADNQFNVLHVHDLGEKLRSKGFEFAHQVKVFEVCSPAHAHRVLNRDIRINMALPCRISVWQDDNGTHVGYIKPEPMLAMLSDDAQLEVVAGEVEDILKAIVDAVA